MSVLEDLMLRFTTSGFREGRGEIDATAGAIRKTDKAAKEAHTSTVGLGKSFGGLKGMAANAAGMVGIGGLAFGLADAVRHAQHLQDVQSQLGASIHANVRQPAKDATAQMSEFADSLSTKGGFTPTESIADMTQFLRVTKSVGKSESDLTLATNISRGAHVDLSRAVRAVTLLEQGRTQGLSKLGIVVPKVTTAYDNLRATHKHATAEEIAAAKATDALASKQQAMANVSHQYSGAMATYSKTSSGGISNLRNSVEVLSTKLGTLLLPAVNWVVRAFVSMVKPLGEMMGYLKPLLPLIGALTAAWALYKVQQLLSAGATAITTSALVTQTAAGFAEAGMLGALQGAWNALTVAMDLNPFMIVVLAIGLVVGALILAYKHVKWFRDAINDAWQWMKGAASDVASAIVTAFHAVVQFFGHTIPHAVSSAGHAVVGVFNSAIKWFKQYWEPVVAGLIFGPFGIATVEIIKHWGKVNGLFNHVLDTIKHVAPQIARALIWPFMTAFNWVKKHLPHFHKVQVGPVSIPMPAFAEGGPVTATGPYLVGERGPEIVTLPRGGYVTPNNAIGSGGDQAIVIYNILDGKLMSQSVIRQGLLQQSRGG